jgi:hypothetical protein
LIHKFESKGIGIVSGRRSNRIASGKLVIRDKPVVILAYFWKKFCGLCEQPRGSEAVIPAKAKRHNPASYDAVKRI